MFDFKNIYKAYKDCIKHKRNTLNALNFEMNLVENICNLEEELKSRTYRIGKSICFLASSPKLREVFDDINKNIENMLYLTNKIIYHDPTKNYNFKGSKKALDNLPEHKTLFKLPKHKGLAIGNLTSQFFANVYLNKFDHFIKRVLKIKHYIRYVDDFVLFHKSKERLQECKEEIQKYLKENLALELRADSKLKKFNQGLDFLGYIIRPNYLLVRKRVVHNYKYKKAKYLQSYEEKKRKNEP